MKDPRFDDIRPYNDDEVPAAMQRIAESDTLALLSAYVFPDRDVEAVRNMVRSLKTTYEFQHQVMYWVNEQIKAKSITSLTVSGMDRIDRSTAHLYVSNHRDIMLDASLFQNILADNGLEPSEITFGANLMSTQLMIDVGRSNKMFRVERGGNIKDFYRSSVHLSDYIRETVASEGESVWIAQRNGRTKDGNDKTDQGIIKMFWMSGKKDKVVALDDLHIVPIAVSYEWEPCDIQKTLELYQSRSGKYIKKPGEDLASILSGITSQKGHVHFSVCEPVRREELEQLDSLTSVEFNKAVASLLDRKILSEYRLSPNNYIAHDMRYVKRDYYDQGLYDEDQYIKFAERLEILDRYEVEEPDILHDIFLGIYANPVDNCR